MTTPTLMRVGDSLGVALAAIQGLHQLVQEKEAKIDAQQRIVADQRRALVAQQTELTALKDRVAQVELVRGELAELKAAVAQIREGRSQVAAHTDARQ